MQQVVKYVMAMLVMTVTLGSSAAEVADSVAARILGKLQEARPDFNYGAVKASPMPGIYQVQVEQGPLLYVGSEGDFIITGSLYGVVPGGFVDMQELALKPLRKAKLEAIPASEEVVFSPKGKTKASIHVFTDVDCGYCRKLHQEVPELNDLGIEVRYLAYPRAGINSESHRKIALAWCAEDRQAVMIKLKNRQTVDVKYCDENPVADQFRLGNELGVRGTPAIILPDGSLLPGYLPARQLAQRLGL